MLLIASNNRIGCFVFNFNNSNLNKRKVNQLLIVSPYYYFLLSSIFKKKIPVKLSYFNIIRVLNNCVK